MDYSSIEIGEKKLFAKWGKREITHDGVVAIDAYLASKVKVLYILKESNDFPSGSDFTLKDFIKNGARWQSWNNIARWQHGIQTYYQTGTAEYKNHITLTDRKNILRNIAVMNLKKETGGSSSKPQEILNHTINDFSLLKEQLNLYRPDIIICCGTGDIVVQQGLLNDIRQSIESTNETRYIKDSKTLLIKYFHPQAYKNKKILFDILMEVIKDINPKI